MKEYDMKTTEEMHNAYYDKFFQKTGLTFDQVPYYDVEIKIDSLKGANFIREDIAKRMYKRVAIRRIYELFVEEEEKRVNKKWKKRNG